MSSSRKKKSISTSAHDSYTEVSPATLEDSIRARAYEIYMEGGMREGVAEHNWLQAEREIISGKTEGVAA